MVGHTLCKRNNGHKVEDKDGHWIPVKMGSDDSDGDEHEQNIDGSSKENGLQALKE